MEVDPDLCLIAITDAINMELMAETKPSLDDLQSADLQPNSVSKAAKLARDEMDLSSDEA